MAFLILNSVLSDVSNGPREKTSASRRLQPRGVACDNESPLAYLFPYSRTQVKRGDLSRDTGVSCACSLLTFTLRVRYAAISF